MINIEIPNKTFTLYKEGKRTFIHISKTEDSTKLLENLKFGDEVNLVNEETKENFEQTFWHYFNFKENDRFLIISFKHEVKDSLFYKRRSFAKSLSSSFKTADFCINDLSNYQRYSQSMLGALTSLFFVELNYKNIWEEGQFVNFYNKTDRDLENRSGDTSFIVLNELRLKTNKEEIFYVYSLFPTSFFHL